MRKILRTCLNVITDLTKDCIKCIHLQENKSSDLHILQQTKLAFSLQQIISFAKLGYEMDYLEDNTDGDLVYYTMFKYCTKRVQTVLSDSNKQVHPYACCIPLWSLFPSMRQLKQFCAQVQTIGLQVLKGLVQKSTNVEDSTFSMLFVGELAADFFVIIQNTLKVFPNILSDIVCIYKL